MAYAKILSLAGIGVGLVVFGVEAAMASGLALVGIAVASASAASYTWASLGRKVVTLAVVTGLGGSIIAWVVARSMMRLVAITSEVPPVFTIEGTAAILGTSVVMSVLPAMGYAHFRRRFGSSLRASLQYGAILVAVGSVPVILLVFPEIASIARVPLIPVAVLLGVPIVYTLSMEAGYRLLRAGGPANLTIPSMWGKKEKAE